MSDRRLKITVLTAKDKVRIFTYVNENSPSLKSYINDALRYLGDDGKIVITEDQGDD